MYSITYLTWKTMITGHKSEILEVGWVLALTQWELGQASVIYVIWRQVIVLSAFHCHYWSQSISNVFIEQSNVLTVILNQTITQWALKPCLSSIFEQTDNHSFSCNHQGLLYFNLIHRIMFYFSFTDFTFIWELSFIQF